MRLPDVVLRQIVDDLLQDAEPFFPGKAKTSWCRFTESWDEPRHILEFDTLWNMTLVHRSWTCIAQRGFWSRAIIPGERLQAACSKQSRSACLRELAIEVGKHCMPAYQATELAARLLRHAPEVRSLYLIIQRSCGDHIPILLHQLRRQEKIERLWLAGATLSLHSGNICRVIAELKNLKGLILSCEMHDTAFQRYSNQFGNLGSRPKQLSSVAVHTPLGNLINEGGFLMKWLLRSNTVEGSVKHLHFSSDRYINKSATGEYDYLHECFNRLQTLHLDECSYYDDIWHRMDDLLLLASNIRELILTYRDTVQNTPMQFPRSLSKLNIQIRRHLVPVADKDPPSTASLAKQLQDSDTNTSNLVANWSAALLSSGQSPDGKKFIVSVSCIRPELRSIVASAFPVTTHTCQQKGISLAVESYPSFRSYTEAV